MIPIATDTSVRRTPWMNYILIGLNVLILLVEFVVEHLYSSSSDLSQMVQRFHEWGTLDASYPELYQFFTYQFLHGGTGHLLGNMLFLWVFGNPVNAKMGHGPYLFFYLACGVFAAAGFAINHDNPMVGASGSIAGITAAYLALFPRSHITVLYFWFFIGTFEIPSLWLIVFKMVLYDNILAPSWFGESNVAYGAHLAGYAFGFLAVAVLLALRLLPRDQFDIVALWRRWFQRQAMQAAMADPNARAQAQYGRVARPVSVRDVTDTSAADPRQEQITELRRQIGDLLARNARDEAADLYAHLLELDPRQVLPRFQQMDVANQLYTLNRTPQAAAAYEKYLTQYANSPDAHEVRLLLGIIYARDLQQYEVAAAHLRPLLDQLTDDKRQEQCRRWLKVAYEALGRSEPEV